MPIYEYKCESCQIVIEKIQKFSDPLLTECEKCGGKLNKLLSQSSFALKGSGWYVTDYAKKSSSEPKSESKSESTSNSSSSSEPSKESSKESPKESSPAPCATSSSTGACGSGACNATNN